MTIYIDIVFLENIIMNYIIILATSLILKVKTRKWKIFIGSMIGAIYTVIAYISKLEVYSNLIVKFILSIVIVYVSLSPQKMKTLWKDLLFFYLTSFLFGGVAFALIYIIKPQEILIKNGLFLGTYPLKTIIISAIVAYIILTVSFKMIKNKVGKKNIYCTVRIKLNKDVIETIAMIDTGNLLKEPISNTPVMIVEHTLLYNTIPKEILDNLEDIIGGDLKKVPEDIREEYSSKLKFIPFSSLGRQHGMLLGVRAKYIEIIKTNEDEEVEIERRENIIIGIYNKSLTKKGEYRALIGMEVI